MQGEVTGPSAAVIGLGLNCRLPNNVRERIDQPVVDLAQITGTAPDRNRLLAVLLEEMSGVLETFAQSGFVPLREEWDCHHVYRGKHVRLTLPDAATIDGVARGVDENGALLLDTSNGVRRVHSGDASLRSARRD